MKITFNLDDDFPLKTLEFYNMIIVLRSVFFFEDNKYYSQIFLNE